MWTLQLYYLNVILDVTQQKPFLHKISLTVHYEADTALHGPHCVLCPAGVDPLVLRHDAPDDEPGLPGPLHHLATLPGPGEHGPGVTTHLALQADVLTLPSCHVHWVSQEVGLNWDKDN